MTKGTVTTGRLAAFICALFLSLNSDALTLADDRDSYEAAAGMQWLGDEDHSLSPALALQALLGGKGQKLDSPDPSLGFREGYQWFLIPVKNNSTLPYWFLRVGRPHLDYLDIYVFDKDGNRIKHARMGDRVPFHSRELPHYHLVTPLTLPADSEHYLLLRAQGNNVIELPATLMTPAAFNAHDNKISVFYGLYFGAIVAMCLFNLLIFLSIRDPSYLLYVLYLGTFGLNLFTREGLSYHGCGLMPPCGIITPCRF